jgi:tetratricopeptide (TPR) repeat protein
MALLLVNCKNGGVEKIWKEKVKKGDYYFTNNNIDMAINCWIESLQFKKDLTTYEKIIASLIIKKNFEEAKKYTIEGLTYFENNDNLLFNLGLVSFYLEDYELSLKTLEKLIRKNRYYPNTHLIRGIIYEKKGEKEKAKKEFIEELNINPASRKAWAKIKEMENGKEN